MLATIRKSACMIAILALSFLAMAGAASYGQVTEDSWVSKAPMHEARIGLGAAAVNGKIYAIGGNTGYSVSAVNEEYDPTTDTWTYKSPIPTPRYGFAIAAYENKIYCMGGKADGRSAVGVNEVYDTSTDTWQTLTAMPTARMDAEAVALNGKIYVMGGRVSDESGSTTFSLNEVYDPRTDMWSTKTPMPQASAGIVTAVVNERIYAISSSIKMVYDPKNGSTYTISSLLNMIYDTQNDSWSQGAPPPNPHNGVGGATTGTFAPKRIYVFSYDKGQCYDPRTDRWTDTVSKPTFEAYPGFTMLNDKIYVIGGLTDLPANDPSSQWVLNFNPQQVYTAVNEEYTPIGYGTPDPSLTLPIITIQTPESVNYNVSSVPLNFTVNKPTDWLGYSLDGQENVTIRGNTTISNLPNGLHNVTVYANDTFSNTGASEPVSFTINQSAYFPAVEVAAATITIAATASGLVYFKKRKKRV